MKDKDKDKDKEKLIPRGQYCYDYSGRCCPFWKTIKNRPYQLNGYCEYLKIGDWMDECDFKELWNQVKECNMNMEDRG